MDSKAERLDKGLAPGMQTRNTKFRPVFDRARDTPANNGELRFGLRPAGGTLSSMWMRRDEKDRREGTPVTAQLLGDPHPDRLAIAEEARQRILGRESKHKIAGSVDRVNMLAEPRVGRKPQNMSRTPDTPRPVSYYIDIPKEHALLEARYPGNPVPLLFVTYSDAARCLTGAMTPSAVKAIKNAASGIVSSAFGWEWTRLRDGRGLKAARK